MSITWAHPESEPARRKPVPESGGGAKPSDRAPRRSLRGAARTVEQRLRGCHCKRRSRTSIPGVPKRHRAAVRVRSAHLGRQSEFSRAPPLPRPEHGGRRAHRATSSGGAEVASNLGSVGALPRSIAVQLRRLCPITGRRVLLRAQFEFLEELVTVCICLSAR